MPVHLIIVTMIFIVVDILVGLIKALATKSYKSRCMAEGLYHKIGEVLIIAFGMLCEYSFPVIGLNVDLPIVSTICVYIVTMETGSVLENIAAISPTVNNLIGNVFGNFVDKDESRQ